jgi:hypothetical protein
MCRKNVKRRRPAIPQHLAHCKQLIFSPDFAYHFSQIATLFTVVEEVSMRLGGAVRPGRRPGDSRAARFLEHRERGNK